jgi:Xaa-Pro aminopeptidase
MQIVKEKINQACGLLGELDIDLWAIFVRETLMLADPTLKLVVGGDATWPSFFVYTRKGDAIALVGKLDQEDFIRSGCFTEVITYTRGVKDDFVGLVNRLDPHRMAVNYSENNPAADGLTHGMYLMLTGFLEGTPYRERLVSAEEVCSKLRSRKLPVEIERLSAAARLATEVWDEVTGQVKVGMSEKDVAALFDAATRRAGHTSSFATLVNAGDKTQPGHGHPSDARLEPGDLLHVDFGVKYEDYCSDIQRLLYFRRPGEREVPETLKDAFDMVRSIIDQTAEMCRPGVKGYEIDSLARRLLTDNGYPEYEHGLGHQLGRDVHDGGALIGPRWERYGNAPVLPLEEGNVFTLDLEIILPGIGCVGLEENICVTPLGARFLCPRQTALVVK